MAVAPYGSWVSPIGIDALAEASNVVFAPRIDRGQLYWLLSQPSQGGRVGLWRQPLVGGAAEELTPAVNVRTRVHEYGGGEYDVADGIVCYVDFADGRIYRVDGDGDATAITAAGELRFADLRIHPDRRLVLAVREDHRGPAEAINTIVALDLDGPNEDGGRVLCAGRDFYSTPELSADGRLAWVEWDHPNMPWDSTAVMVGRLADDTVADARPVAGGEGLSAVQPRWLGDRLLYLSDETGWWNPYLLDLGSDGGATALCLTEAEFCTPQWQFGQQPYAILDDGALACAIIRAGEPQIVRVDLGDGAITPLTEPGTGAAGVVGDGRIVAAVLQFRDRPAALSLLDVSDAPEADVASAAWRAVQTSGDEALDPAVVSVAQAVSWPSDQGDVHGWYYPPTNPRFTAPEGTLPPLITLSHGGPTACSVPVYRLEYQFWTSRGYAILDVNYGGSTGYGRAYRDRLKGTWGFTDLYDCAGGATALGERGLADPARLAVKGGSAGGYTTLRALTASRVFAAGISLYGVGDLEALARDTHKFESRYLDGLVGPYPADRQAYIDRSPINHVDQLAAPILLLQGLDDKVVPPNQADLMADAARRNGLPVALIMFAGESHGFRKAETIKASTAAQIYFLGRIFDFVPADDVSPIPIDNL